MEVRIEKGLLYSETHEWVQMLDDTTALVGLTDFAQKALSDIVFVELPKKGRNITCGKSFGNVESVKAVSPINSQLSGVLEEINSQVEDTPELINQDPYGCWLVKVSGITEKIGLMDAQAYEKLCEELSDEYFEEE